MEAQHLICKQRNHKEGVRRNEKFANFCEKKKREAGEVVFSLLSKATYTVVTAVAVWEGETAQR